MVIASVTSLLQMTSWGMVRVMWKVPEKMNGEDDFRCRRTMCI